METPMMRPRSSRRMVQQIDESQTTIPQSLQDQLEARFAKLKSETYAVLTELHQQDAGASSSQQQQPQPQNGHSEVQAADVDVDDLDVDVDDEGVVHGLANVDDVEDLVHQPSSLPDNEPEIDFIDQTINRALSGYRARQGSEADQNPAYPTHEIPQTTDTAAPPISVDSSSHAQTNPAMPAISFDHVHDEQATRASLAVGDGEGLGAFLPVSTPVTAERIERINTIMVSATSPVEDDDPGSARLHHTMTASLDTMLGLIDDEPSSRAPPPPPPLEPVAEDPANISRQSVDLDDSLRQIEQQMHEAHGNMAAEEIRRQSEQDNTATADDTTPANPMVDDDNDNNNNNNNDTNNNDSGALVGGEYGYGYDSSLRVTMEDVLPGMGVSGRTTAAETEGGQASKRSARSEEDNLDAVLMQAEERLRGMEALHMDMADTQTLLTNTTSLVLDLEEPVDDRVRPTSQRLSGLTREQESSLMEQGKRVERMKKQKSVTLDQSWLSLEVDIRAERQMEAITARTKHAQNIIQSNLGDRVSVDKWVDALKLCNTMLAADLKKAAKSSSSSPHQELPEFRALLESYFASQIELKQFCRDLQIGTRNIVKLAKTIWTKHPHEVNVPVKFDDGITASTTHTYNSYDFSTKSCTSLRDEMDLNSSVQFTEGAGLRYASAMRLASLESFVDDAFARLSPVLKASDPVAIMPRTDTRAEPLLQMTQIVFEFLWKAIKQRDAQDAEEPTKSQKGKPAFPPNGAVIQKLLEDSLVALVKRIGAAVLRCGSRQHHLDFIHQLLMAPAGSLQSLGQLLVIPTPTTEIGRTYVLMLLNDLAGAIAALPEKPPEPGEIVCVRECSADLLSLLDQIDCAAMVHRLMESEVHDILRGRHGMETIRFVVQLTIAMLRPLSKVKAEDGQRALAWHSVQILRSLNAACLDLLMARAPDSEPDYHGDFPPEEYLSGGVCFALFMLLRRNENLWNLASSLDFGCCSPPALWACFHMLSYGPGKVPEDSAVGTALKHTMPSGAAPMFRSLQAEHLLAALTKLALATAHEDLLEQNTIAEACVTVVLNVGFVWLDQAKLNSAALQALRSVCKFQPSMLSKMLRLLDVALESDESNRGKRASPIATNLPKIVHHVVAGQVTWFPSSYDLQRISKWLQQPLGSGAIQAGQVLLHSLNWEECQSQTLPAETALVLAKALAHHTDSGKGSIFGGGEREKLLRMFNVWVWNMLNNFRFHSEDGVRLVPLRPRSDAMVSFILRQFKSKDSRASDFVIAYVVLCVCGTSNEGAEKRTTARELIGFLLENKRLSAVLSLVPTWSAELVLGSDEDKTFATYLVANLSAFLTSTANVDKDAPVVLVRRVCGVLSSLLKRQRGIEAKALFGLWFLGLASGKWKTNVGACVMLNAFCKWAFAKQLRMGLTQPCLLRALRNESGKQVQSYPFTNTPHFVFRSDRVHVFESAVDYPWLVFEVLWFESQLLSSDWVRAAELLKPIKWKGGFLSRKPAVKAILSKCGAGYFSSQSPLHRWVRFTTILPASHPAWPMFLQCCTILYLFEHPGEASRGVPLGQVGHQMWHLLVDGDSKSKRLREVLVTKLDTAGSENPRPSDATLALCRAMHNWWSSSNPEELLRNITRLGPQYAPDYVRLCADTALLTRRTSGGERRTNGYHPILSDSWASALVDKENVLNSMKTSQVDLSAEAIAGKGRRGSVASQPDALQKRASAAGMVAPTISERPKTMKFNSLELKALAEGTISAALPLQLGVSLFEEIPNLANTDAMVAFVIDLVQQLETACVQLRSLAEQAMLLNREYTTTMFPKLYSNGPGTAKVKIQHPKSDKSFSVDVRLQRVGTMQSDVEKQMIHNRKQLFDVLRQGVWEPTLSPKVELKAAFIVRLLLMRLATHPTLLGACEQVLFSVSPLLHSRTRILMPLRQSVESWVHALCLELSPPRPPPSLAHIPGKLMAAMLSQPDGAVPVLVRHFAPDLQPSVFVQLYREISEVALVEFGRRGVLEVLQRFDGKRWMSKRPPEDEVTSLLELVSRNLSKTFRVIVQKFPDQVAVCQMWNSATHNEDTLIKSSNNTLDQASAASLVRLLGVLEHHKGIWLHGVLHKFPMHFLQATKWLLDASAKQLAPSSMWMEMVFNIEIKAFLLTSAQASTTLGLIRKHIHAQRTDQRKDIFSSWKYYLQPILTFIESIVSPQLAVSQDAADNESLRLMLKSVLRMAEEFLCVHEGDPFDWESPLVVSMCDQCIRWLQGMVANFGRYSEEQSFRMFWDAFIKRIVPHASDTVVEAFRVTHFIHAGRKWRIPERVIDAEMLTQMRQLLEKRPSSQYFVHDLVMSLPLPHVVPSNLCAPLLGLAISLFRVLSMQLTASAQIAGEKSPILTLLRKFLVCDWRHSNANSINPILFELSSTYTTFFHGCNFSTTKVFVSDLTGPISFKTFLAHGSGFLATVLLLRTACLRSPNAFESYFEFMSGCVSVHASLATPNLRALQTITKWMCRDFHMVMSWMCEMAPQLNIFPTKIVPTNPVGSDDPEAKSALLRPAAIKTISSSALTQRNNFTLPSVVPVRQNLAAVELTRVLERLMGLWGTVTCLFNLDMAVAPQVGLIVHILEVLSISPGALCGPALASLCDCVSDVEKLAASAESMCEVLLCSPPPEDCHFVTCATIAWKEAQSRMRFPDSDQPKFLQAAHTDHSLIVLTLAMVYMGGLGDTWSTDTRKRLAGKSLERAQVNMLRWARTYTEWVVRFTTPQPPIPHVLLDKLMLAWSVATLSCAKAVVIGGLTDPNTDISGVLSHHFINLAQQGEKGGFFQKLTQKAVFGVDTCLALRLYGTAVGCLSPRTTAKERTAWTDKLGEFKKSKHYVQWTALLDWMLLVLPSIEPRSPETFTTIHNLVSKVLTTIATKSMLFVPLVLDTDLHIVATTNVASVGILPQLVQNID